MKVIETNLHILATVKKKKDFHLIKINDLNTDDDFWVQGVRFKMMQKGAWHKCNKFAEALFGT